MVACLVDGKPKEDAPSIFQWSSSHLVLLLADCVILGGLPFCASVSSSVMQGHNNPCLTGLLGRRSENMCSKGPGVWHVLSNDERSLVSAGEVGGSGSRGILNINT